MRSKVLLFFIFICFLLLQVEAQVQVDTTTNAYTLRFENNQAVYQYQNSEGELRSIEIDEAYADDYRRFHPKFKKSEKIKPGVNPFFYNEKISRLEDFEPICPQTFDKVNGEIESFYIVSKNDSCFLLNKETCVLQFFHEFIVEDLILPYNYRSIQIYNEYHKTLTVYNPEGIQQSVISLEDIYFAPIDNGYFVQMGLEETSRAKWDFTNQFLNNQGKIIGKGKMICLGKDVLGIKKENGDIDYYYKNKKRNLPNDLNYISYKSRDNFCEVITTDKLKGIYTIDFSKKLLEAKYRSIKSVNLEPKVREDYQTGYNAIEKGRFYFYVLDTMNQLHVFHSDGEEVKLNQTYIDANLKHYKIAVQDFFVITDKSLNLHIYDQEWNFLGTEKDKTFGKNSDEEIYKYYFLFGRSALGLKALSTAGKKLEDDFFFIINNKKGGQNIADKSLKPLLSKDYCRIKKIGSSRFILSDSKLDFESSTGESVIVELKELE